MAMSVPIRMSRLASVVWKAACASLLASCGGGGGTGTPQDSGPNKTYLSVQANDLDGDVLHYQWRVTAGSIENRDSPQTVWTMPDGPGLHFAYVIVSDGKGGYAEQQYAVATDALETSPPSRSVVARVPPATDTTRWSAGRLRFVSADSLARLTKFATGGAVAERLVYLPDVQVELDRCADLLCNAVGSSAFSGKSDLSGELSLPDLEAGTYLVRCSTVFGAPLGHCGSLVGNVAGKRTLTVTANGEAQVRTVPPPLPSARNLRLYGHVALADGAMCGIENEFAGTQSAATVQLLQADGTPLAPPTRVNRFGDYAVDAPVLARGQYSLKVVCEGYNATLPVPASTQPVGYVATAPIELTHQIANARPSIAKVVANGPDGNVRGLVVVTEDGVSTSLPGWRQFLAYKGADTRQSACTYYKSIGAVSGCDAQGNLQNPITLDDWMRQKKLKPYDSGNKQVSAVYINRMDLNLVRRMYATQAAANDIAFVVCNHPGPEGSSQAEVDKVIDLGLSDLKRVACVAMEWSTSPGLNGGNPFTKFLTFGPDGSLIPSINLDGRGEKYMPGACVACHGGTQYNGHFTEAGLPSAYLGAGFLPFDTGNYLFGSAAGLSEAEQSQAFFDLNDLVRKTDSTRAYKSTSNLIDGWYSNGTTTTLNKQYVPQRWRDAETAGQTGAATFYREVIGGVCRTCHVAMGSFRFDWDANVGVVTNPDPGGLANQHFCGGRSDVAINASMPNALISRDRLADRIAVDPALAALMQKFLGCVTPSADPAYAKK